jgi:two-component system, chemotaxis family, response regulator Rcp1
MTDAMVHGRPAEILLVEDSEDDVELTKIGFRRAKFAVSLHHVGNGEECMSFLRKEGKYAGVPTPDLILLDLNMPRMDGNEVMEEIARDEKLKHLPIVVLTSSQAEEDILRSYKLRCSSYLVKPINFEGFAKMVQSLTDYWFTLVTLPPNR